MFRVIIYKFYKNNTILLFKCGIIVKRYDKISINSSVQFAELYSPFTHHHRWFCKRALTQGAKNPIKYKKCNPAERR